MCVNNWLLCLSHLKSGHLSVICLSLRIIGMCERARRLLSFQISNEFETHVFEHSAHDNYGWTLKNLSTWLDPRIVVLLTITLAMFKTDDVFAEKMGRPFFRSAGNRQSNRSVCCQHSFLKCRIGHQMCEIFLWKRYFTSMFGFLWFRIEKL